MKPAPDDDPQRGEVRAVLRERVGGHLPAALAQRVRDVEDREVVDRRPSSVNANTGSSSPRVISSNGPSSAICAGEARRDVARVALHLPVAVEAEPEEVVVLRDDLRARAARS